MYILYDSNYSKQPLNAAHALPPLPLISTLLFYLPLLHKQNMHSNISQHYKHSCKRTQLRHI